MKQSISENGLKENLDLHQRQSLAHKQNNNLDELQLKAKENLQKQENKFQKCVQLKELQAGGEAGIENVPSAQLTKRSDQSQFRDWQITTVRSGKFQFNQRKQLPLGKKTDEERYKKVQTQVQEEVKPTKTLKVNKTLGAHKKQIQKYFGLILNQVLAQNKLIKVIFGHFCKDNNLTSIKSTLFDDKQKIMQQMSLNKWMVFCKEFEIYSKLCKLKSSARKAQVGSEQLTLQTSQVRQLHMVKESKQVQKTLMGIFKKVNQNASKMNYQSFVLAVSELFHEFKPLYAEQQSGISEFLNEVLYCSQQKSCFKKLSHLKFTSIIPQISYNKVPFPKRKITSRSKSKLTLSKQKENRTKDKQTGNSIHSKPKMNRNFTQLNLNPILYEAKKMLNHPKKHPQKTHDLNRSIPRIKLKDLQNQKEKQKQKEKELIDYFESSKDPILQSYFSMEKVRKNQTKK